MSGRLNEELRHESIYILFFIVLNSTRLGSILLYLKWLLFSYKIYPLRITLSLRSRAAGNSIIAAEVISPLHPMLDIRLYPTPTSTLQLGNPSRPNTSPQLNPRT